MAAVLNFDTGSPADAPGIAAGCDVDSAFETAFGLLATLPARTGVPRIQRYRQRLTSIELEQLKHTIDAAGGDTKGAEKVVGKSGKVSKTEKKKAIARAKLNAKNPAIAEKMASEELTEEQVDVIADTG